MGEVNNRSTAGFALSMAGGGNNFCMSRHTYIHPHIEKLNKIKATSDEPHNKLRREIYTQEQATSQLSYTTRCYRQRMQN